MAGPDLDLANHIASQLSKWVVGTNLFYGKERAAGGLIPEESTYCLKSGGPAPENYMGSDDQHRFSAVQVITRSNPRDFATGQTNADAIHNVVDRAEIAGYTDVRVNESEPNYAGEDEDGLHTWTINAELWREV